ncbi:PQQ-dependent sugar dehydrogenase [Vibrio sinensis]|uniref:PQQ-dependent sugar dehydrogenase n=1 Tax=Vibrio sinensis TaxID=2302434 RepID=A0A3A6QJA3_9VIBR|nr:PQQ-dependent sugar dehydrogenase [Vibrio sinensis]RJX70152.1 PQQ-dependent sugar dehydrogenase [Vibrio sinensis]
MRKLWIFCLIVCSNQSFATPTSATKWHAEEVISGLGVPWGMAPIDQHQVLITERNGRVGILNHSTQKYQPIFHFPNVVTNGQGGLLDVAPSPFDDKAFYFTYSKEVEAGIETALAKAYLVENHIVGLTELFVSSSGSTTNRHFGSRIAFDQYYLYLSIGDRGERENGQNLTTHAGSIIRLNPDGTPPKDNPFAEQNDAQNAIWSYGHRNPQGIIFLRDRNELWSVEHGPRGGDEVNLIVKGANYGWPITSHGKEYWNPLPVGQAQEMKGIESPKKVYIPSIAPSSMIYYQGEQYPNLKNKLLLGALKLTHINILTLDAHGNIIEEQRILSDLKERIRALTVTPDGHILFSSDSGKVYRLSTLHE